MSINSRVKKTFREIGDFFFVYRLYVCVCFQNTAMIEPNQNTQTSTIVCVFWKDRFLLYGSLRTKDMPSSLTYHF